MKEVPFKDRCVMFILPDFGEDHWALCLTIPGIVLWKGEDKTIADSAIRFEERFNKERHSFCDVIEIGKKTCQRYGWLWEDDFFGEHDELIDYSVDPPRNLYGEAAGEKNVNEPGKTGMDGLSS